MLKYLKSMLSVAVAPGGSYVSISPLSFPLFARINVVASAGEQSQKLAEVADDLDRTIELLANDQLVAGRVSLVAARESLREVTGE